MVLFVLNAFTLPMNEIGPYILASSGAGLFVMLKVFCPAISFSFHYSVQSQKVTKGSGLLCTFRFIIACLLHELSS